MEEILLAGLGYDIIKAFLPIEGEKIGTKKAIASRRALRDRREEEIQDSSPGFRIPDRGIVHQHDICTRAGPN
ncbi:MAG TPA: hypothetical protein VEL68_16440 [Thermodesulfobacteriota bacterium]|nr:hypothetical protein [Thermodesulfobacteriota bacterium]